MTNCFRLPLSCNKKLSIRSRFDQRRQCPCMIRFHMVHYYVINFSRVVKDGDKLSLGKRELTFVTLPMLHWPDSMATYCADDGILFSNDAFGQHYAAAKRFYDEVDLGILFYEAKKYFAR